MEITINPPQLLLWVCLAVFGVSLLAILLKQGKWRSKILSMGVMILVLGCVLFFFYRDSTILINEEGIRSDGYGKDEFSWEQVKKIAVIDQLENSPYKPRVKFSGLTVGTLKLGWFILANGDKAKVLIQTNGQALLIATGEKKYLLALKQMDQVIHAIKQYYPLEVQDD